MRRFAICLAMVVFLAAGGAAIGGAEEVTVTASTALRAVNPNDSHDVRYLCTFDLPRDLLGADILRAYITVATDASQSMTLAVSALEAAWSTGDSWATLGTKLSGSEGFVAPDGSAHVASNDVIQEGGGAMDHGLEISISDVVRRWLDGNNYGLCIRRIVGDGSDASAVLASDLDLPSLTIVYVK